MDRPWKKHRVATVSDFLGEWLDGFGSVSLATPQWALGQVAHPHITIHVDHFVDKRLTSSRANDGDIGHANAMALRRLMEGMNAIACCKGFVPDKNPAFWREILPRGAGDSATALSRITRQTLSRYHISIATETNTCDPERLAEALAACFSNDPTSDAMGVRAKVSSTLQGLTGFRYQPPAVEIKFYVDRGSFYDVQGIRFDWSLWRRMMLHLNRILMEEKNRMQLQTHETVCVVFGQIEVNAAAVTEIADVVAHASPHVLLTELHCTQDGLFGRSFHSLMRALSQADTLRCLSWKFWKFDEQCVAAIFSALPWMMHLQSFRIFIEDFQDDQEQERSCHWTLYYRWLAYALLSRSLRGAPALKLETFIDKGALNGFSDAIQDVNCMAPNIRVMVAATEARPIYLPHGAVADVVGRAATTASPSSRRDSVNSTSDFVVHQTNANGFDVVAIVGDQVIIVVPGIGLQWVSTAALTNWRSLHIAPLAADADELCSQIASSMAALVCHYGDFTGIVPWLRFFAGTKLGLYPFFNRISELLAESLGDILTACPNLTSLAILNGDLESFGPLIHAFDRNACQIDTFLYCGIGSERDTLELLESLADPTRTIGRVVKTLGFIQTPLDQDEVATIMKAIEDNKVLSTLCCSVRGSLDYVGTGRRLLDAAIDSTPLLQSDESKTAAYTYLLASKHWRLPVPCSRLVVEFAAIPSLRQVSWARIVAWHGITGLMGRLASSND